MKYAYWKELKPGFWDLIDSEDNKLLAYIDIQRNGAKWYLNTRTDYNYNSYINSGMSWTIERAKQICEDRIAECGWQIVKDERLKNFL